MSLVAYSDSEESDGGYEDGFVLQHGDGQHFDVSSEDEMPLAGLTAAKPKSVDKGDEHRSSDATVHLAHKSSLNERAGRPCWSKSPRVGSQTTPLRMTTRPRHS